MLDYNTLTGKDIKALLKFRGVAYGMTEKRDQLVSRLENYRNRKGESFDPVIEEMIIELNDYSMEQLRDCVCKYKDIVYQMNDQRFELIKICANYVQEHRESDKELPAVTHMRSVVIERPLDKWLKKEKVPQSQINSKLTATKSLANLAYEVEHKPSARQNQLKKSTSANSMAAANRSWSESEVEVIQKLEAAPIRLVRSLCEKYNIEHSDSSTKKDLILQVVLHLRLLKEQASPSSSPNTTRKYQAAQPQRPGQLKSVATIESQQAAFQAAHNERKVQQRLDEAEREGTPAYQLVQLLSGYTLEQLKTRAFSSGVGFSSGIEKRDLIKLIVTHDIKSAGMTSTMRPGNY